MRRRRRWLGFNDMVVLGDDGGYQLASSPGREKRMKMAEAKSWGWRDRFSALGELKAERERRKRMMKSGSRRTEQSAQLRQVPMFCSLSPVLPTPSPASHGHGPIAWRWRGSRLRGCRSTSQPLEKPKPQNPYITTSLALSFPCLFAAPSRASNYFVGSWARGRRERNVGFTSPLTTRAVVRPTGRASLCVPCDGHTA